MNQQQNQSGGGTAIRGGKIDNVLYDVITVLHEKSKGLEAYDKYERDLQGNQEVKQVFDEIRRQDEQAVQRLEECLRTLMTGSGESQSGRGQGRDINRAA
jgi:ferritin-like metal-binding protein YciE